MNINAKKLGQAVRSFRRQQKLTQAELARRSGLAANTVALLERGERGYSVGTINRLARALDMPAACLTVMGTLSPGKKDPAAADLLEKLQQLIVSVEAAKADWSDSPPKKRRSRRRKVKVPAN